MFRPLLCWLFAMIVGCAPALAEDFWNAGAGKAVITPKDSMWMAGFMSRKGPSEGTLSDLHAKALLLEDKQGNRGLIVTMDLIGIDREVSEQLCQAIQVKHGLPRRQITLCVSHTHSGPVVGRNLGPAHYYVLDGLQRAKIDAYTKFLTEGVLAAVDEAFASLAPARLQWGSGQAGFAVNRRNNMPEDVPALRKAGKLKGPVDHSVPVLSVRDPQGEIRAILCGYACHATSLGMNEYRWSADYPGYAQERLEKQYPDSVALFWAGCGADQNPLPLATEALAQQYGKELAEAVEEVLNSPMGTIEPKLGVSYQEVAAGLDHLPSADDLKRGTASSDKVEAARAKLLQDTLKAKGSLAKEYATYPVGVWKLGNAVDFVFLGGEAVVDYALRLKKEMRGEQTWVASYSNDVMADVPTARILKEGGYEGGGSNLLYGLPGLWSEKLEQTIVAAVHAGSDAAVRYDSGARWAKAMQAFKAADQKSPAPKNPLLFVGSSSIVKWDLKQSWPDQPVLNRGFGGSTIADTVHFFDTVVAPYKPRAIFFYAGDNDLAMGLSPDAVTRDFQKLADLVKQKLPGTPLTFIAIKPSPKRWELWPSVQKTNAAIEKICAADANLRFADITGAMMREDGTPDPGLFVSDMLHMNPAGYEKWTAVLNPFLPKGFAATPASMQVAESAPKPAVKKMAAASSAKPPRKDSPDEPRRAPSKSPAKASKSGAEDRASNAAPRRHLSAPESQVAAKKPERNAGPPRRRR